MPGTRSSRPATATASRLLHEEDDVALNAQPLACADALARTADECQRQRERLARLIARNVGRAELNASAAIVDTCDLALEECIACYEDACAHESIGEEGVRKLASGLWHAAREYLRRCSSAEQASQQLRNHDAEALGDLHFAYELEASALLALRHACAAYFKVRPEAA
jgi:hypothetical protein